MPAKRYLVQTGLTYPLNPKAPRDEWELTRAEPGDVVDNLPATSVGWLVEQGLVVEAGRDRTQLPDDFPGRAALTEAGITTYGEVEQRFDELLELKGIGQVTFEQIRAALVEHGEEESDGGSEE